MAEADATCASVAREHDEALFATASGARSWLLIEQGGAWGPDALTQSRLPAPFAGILAEMAQALNVRVLLLRRTEAPTVSHAGVGHRIFFAHSGRHQRWIAETEVDDPTRLLEMDLRPLGRGRPPAGTWARSAPLYLVCTNGRHDPCCAQLGRPVARALARRGEADVWECSHIGGDRFAGNLVCLPHGLYFGRLGPLDGRRVVAAYERGRIELDHYRGRAGDPFPVQAAEYYVRQSEYLLGVDDLLATDYRRPEPKVAEVRFNGPGGRRYDVRVAVTDADDPRLLTCRSTRPEHPTTYRLLDLRVS
jgi:hypothetical protein